MSWWLPPNYATHGESMDHLFLWIFWITMVVMVGTFAAMLYFMVKYRHRADRKKAHFSHGNHRLEVLWTILPSIILIAISLYSKKVWEEYRYGRPVQAGNDPARLLVIAQQFQWNVIYPGPNGKLGRYLVYPKPTDRLWPTGPDGQPFTFTFEKYDDTNGPADMPFEDAKRAINAYIDSENPLGKVFDDPDGKDDNFENQPGRPLYLPKGRPIELQLSSKDVIHDFYLPNFRVKLDAVPGLRGVLYFDANISSREREDLPENRLTFKSVDEALQATKQPERLDNQFLGIVIDQDSKPRAADAKSAGAFPDPASGAWQYNDREGKKIVADREPLTKERLEALKAIGVGEVRACRPGYFDLVCGELCGQGHYKMQGQVFVLPAAEYAKRFETKAAAAPAAAEK
ncbi:MAG TPA: cytochrome c oxidase subunit II transmembrane domain-containing protein, partial [Gemmataceae bacterium]|nr:cytochrome c oxidase subunit II transmembrane domain-containing protein [Gemmataceae bacterium]